MCENGENGENGDKNFSNEILIIGTRRMTWDAFPCAIHHYFNNAILSAVQYISWQQLSWYVDKNYFVMNER